MKEIFELLSRDSWTTGTVLLTLAAVFAYFAKVAIEKWLESRIKRGDDVRKTSLDVKKDLRKEERGELVAFRDAIERWENFLQTSVFEFTMKAPSQAEVGDLFKRENETFLAVKIALGKAAMYLRSKDIEQQQMSAVLNIRQLYFPLINATLPRLAELQAQLLPFETKLKKFQDSGMTDSKYAPTRQDQETNLRLQTSMTDEMQKFAQSLVKEYPAIAKHMADMKEAMNAYFYRPIGAAAIDAD